MRRRVSRLLHGYRSLVCGCVGRHLHIGTWHLFEIRSHELGRDGRATLGDCRRDARRSVDRPSHQNRANRFAAGALRPQRRKSYARDSAHIAHRLFPSGIRCVQNGCGIHDARGGAERCLYRQRLGRMALESAQRLANHHATHGHCGATRHLFAL